MSYIYVHMTKYETHDILREIFYCIVAWTVLLYFSSSLSQVGRNKGLGSPEQSAPPASLICGNRVS